MFDTLKQGYLHRERESLHRGQRWKELADACRKLVEIDPQDFRAMHDLLVALRELKDYRAALPWCEAILKIAPKGAPENILALEGPRYLRYRVVCGEVFLRLGQLDRARRTLAPLKKLGGHFHKKNLLLSEIHEAQGRLAAAAEEVRQMGDTYATAGSQQWDHAIVARARELLAKAVAERDAEAAYILFRTLAEVAARRGELPAYIRAREGDPQLSAEVPILRAVGALIEGRPAEAAAAAKSVPWAELADRILAASLAAEGKFEECAAVLRRLPIGSPLRLELSRAVKGPVAASADFLRELAECHLRAGMLEEAYEAYQSLTTKASCDLKDLERSRELRQMLLDRSIWEDAARLGLLPGFEPGEAGRAARAEVEDVPVVAQGTSTPVRVSHAFRLDALHSVPIDLSEVRMRLAENCLRRGVKLEEAVRLLQDLAQEGGALKARARCQLALHFIRRRETASAQAALREFAEASAGLDEDDRKRMLLDLGDCCEAAGLVDQAKTCYGNILAMDIAYADVQERVRTLEKRGDSARAPESDRAAISRIRQRFADMRAIGRGGMGVVYRAFDPLFSRPVALKVLSERFRGDEAVVARFLREGQAMAQLLRHPGIVRIYEVGAGHDMYIAMEYVPGSSLRSLLKEKGRLPLAEIRELGGQICEALGFAHASGIVHRDIKPDNILLTAEGRAKIADFGLADTSQATMLTQVGTVMGTGPYMPPEQIRGEEADARSDIYALGATLFELATGQVPFPKGDLAHRHLHEAPPSPLTLRPELPASFAALTLRCLEKDRAARFQSCAELSAALAGVR